MPRRPVQKQSVCTDCEAASATPAAGVTGAGHCLAQLAATYPTEEFDEAIFDLIRSTPSLQAKILSPFWAEEHRIQMEEAVARFLAGENEVDSDEDIKVEVSGSTSSCSQTWADLAPPKKSNPDQEEQCQAPHHPEKQNPNGKQQRQALCSRLSKTLVLAKFPRLANELQIAGAFDAVLGRGSMQAGRVVRDKTGESSCFGFFEFADPDTADAAFEACRRNKVVIADGSGRMWHVRASHAKRATVGAGPSGRRGRRGGQGQKIVAGGATRAAAFVHVNPIGSKPLTQ